MTVVVFGIDALDPDLVAAEHHPHLTLEAHNRIQTITSSAGEPSTHELWPTIITGLTPQEHGIQLDDGVAWDSLLLQFGSLFADYLLPNTVQNRIGDWLLTNTDADAFRIPASYYSNNDISTLFDGYDSTVIGVPNYVTDTDSDDREHQLRQQMGDLFERSQEAQGGHISSDPDQFYELCMEMSMVRTARLRRALRSRQHELAFGYTSGLDLIGHVSYDQRKLQNRAYAEINEFVGELHGDLTDDDELVLVSDHGLQDGLHTEEAMVASTKPEIVERIEGVADVREAIEAELDHVDHTAKKRATSDQNIGGGDEIREQLENLGYM